MAINAPGPHASFEEVLDYLESPEAEASWILQYFHGQYGEEPAIKAAIARNPNTPLSVFQPAMERFLKHGEDFLANPMLDLWPLEDPEVFHRMGDEMLQWAPGHLANHELLLGRGGNATPHLPHEIRLRALFFGPVIGALTSFKLLKGRAIGFPFTIELTSRGIYVFSDRDSDAYCTSPTSFKYCWRERYGGLSLKTANARKFDKFNCPPILLADYLQSAQVREGNWQEIFRTLKVPLDRIGAVEEPKIPPPDASNEKILTYLQDPAADQAYLSALSEKIGQAIDELFYGAQGKRPLWNLGQIVPTVISHPNLAKGDLLNGLVADPGAFLRNPALALFLLEDPAYVTDFIRSLYADYASQSDYIQRIFGTAVPTPFQSFCRTELIGEEIAWLSGFTYDETAYVDRLPQKIALTTQGFLWVYSHGVHALFPDRAEFCNEWNSLYMPFSKRNPDMLLHNFVITATVKEGQWERLEQILEVA